MFQYKKNHSVWIFRYKYSVNGDIPAPNIQSVGAARVSMDIPVHKMESVRIFQYTIFS